MESVRLFDWLVNGDYDLALLLPRSYQREGVVSLFLESCSGTIAVVTSRPLETTTPYLFIDNRSTEEIERLLADDRVDLILFDDCLALLELKSGGDRTLPRIVTLASWSDLEVLPRLQEILPRLQVLPLHLRSDTDTIRWLFLPYREDSLLDGVVSHYPASQLVYSRDSSTLAARLAQLSRDKLNPYSEDEVTANTDDLHQGKAPLVAITSTYPSYRNNVEVIHLVEPATWIPEDQIALLVDISMYPALTVFYYTSSEEVSSRGTPESFVRRIQECRSLYSEIWNSRERVVVQLEGVFVQTE